MLRLAQAVTITGRRLRSKHRSWLLGMAVQNLSSTYRKVTSRQFQKEKKEIKPPTKYH